MSFGLVWLDRQQVEDQYRREYDYATLLTQNNTPSVALLRGRKEGSALLLVAVGIWITGRASQPCVAYWLKADGCNTRTQAGLCTIST
jgi:hypothetical protein